MTAADVADGLRLSPGERLEPDARGLAAPALARPWSLPRGAARQRRGGLGRRGPLRRGPGVGLHDPRPAGRARPRSRHARLRRGAGARERPRERRAAASSRPRRDARGPRPLPETRLPDGPALVRLRAPAAASDEHGPASPPAASELDAVLERDREVFGADRARSCGHSRARLPSSPGPCGTADASAATASAVTEITPISSARSSRTTPSPRTISSGPSSPVRAAGRSSSTRAPFPAGSRRSATWGSASSARSRMYLGEARPPARPEHELAILGPEFG